MWGGIASKCSNMCGEIRVVNNTCGNSWCYLARQSIYFFPMQYKCLWAGTTERQGHKRRAPQMFVIRISWSGKWNWYIENVSLRSPKLWTNKFQTRQPSLSPCNHIADFALLPVRSICCHSNNIHYTKFHENIWEGRGVLWNYSPTSQLPHHSRCLHAELTVLYMRDMNQHHSFRCDCRVT